MSAGPKGYDQRLKQYEVTVLEFIDKMNGHFLAYTEDAGFAKTLQNALTKYLAVTKDCVDSATNPRRVLELLVSQTKKGGRPFLFVDRIVQGKTTTDFLSQIRIQYPDIYCIVLSGEADRSALIYLFELGVSNFIIKPISVNTLIEKIALTIRPQTKIGELIDKAKKMLEQGRGDEALALSNQILVLKPNSAAGLMVQGDAYLLLGDKGKAVEAYLNAEKSAKLFLDPLKRLVEFYKIEDDIQAQIKYLGKLDNLSPHNVQRKMELGTLNLEIKNIPEAERHFDGALAVATREALNSVGDVATAIAEICAAGDPAISEKYCRKALEMKRGVLGKSDLEIFNRLGLALRRQGKWSEAIQEYTKAQAIAPQDENLFYNIALAYMEGKKNSMALYNVETALGLNRRFYEGSPVAAYNIGLIYFCSDDPDRAKEYFEQALAMDPHFTEAQEHLEKL